MRRDIHDFCIEQGLKIARHDGQLPALDPAFYDTFLTHMKHGSYYADFGSMRSLSKASFRTHYLRPKSHRGYLPGIRNAGQTCEHFYYLARLYWGSHSYDRAAMYLGASAHLVQDLCNPFHTTHKSLREHTEYERRGMNNIERHAVNEEGIYHFRPLAGHYRDDRAFGWVDFNAHRSGRLLHLVINGPSDPRAKEMTGKIMIAAQRTTAGFLSMFFREVQRGDDVARSSASNGEREAVALGRFDLAVEEAALAPERAAIVSALD